MSDEDLFPEWKRLATLKDKPNAFLCVNVQAALRDACTEVSQLRAVLARTRAERDDALLKLSQVRRPLLPGLGGRR